jgi:metal-dependent amidase/aminoacylase/carboxypeptidase family protein
MRRTASGVAAAFGATAKVGCPDLFAPLVNNPAETEFIANVAREFPVAFAWTATTWGVATFSSNLN